MLNEKKTLSQKSRVSLPLNKPRCVLDDLLEFAIICILNKLHKILLKVLVN